MRKTIFNFIELFIIPILIWYMLKSTSDSIVFYIEERLEPVTVNFNVEKNYLFYLLLHIVDIIIIVLYTFFKDKREIILNKSVKYSIIKDVLIGFVIGATYVTIQIITYCIFGACSLTRGTFSYLIIIYLAFNIIHSLAEELLFRGYFLVNDDLRNKIVWILISSLCFALSHNYEIVNFIDQFIFGLLLAIIVIKRQNIILTTFLHATNNFFLMNIFGTLGSEYQSILYLKDNIDVHIPIFDNGAYVIFLRLTLLFIIFFIFYNNNIIRKK